MVTTVVANAVVLFVDIAITVDSSSSGEDTQPNCIKIDECSCRLKNVESTGVISLVSDKHEPRFVTEGKTSVISKLYGFYYNPCKNFSYLGCTDTAICQQLHPTVQHILQLWLS